MESKENTIMEEIRHAMGRSYDYFDIDKGEIFAHEKDSFSMSVSFTPKDMGENLGYEYTIKGITQYLQFDNYEGQSFLILGEDTECSISLGRIYTALYWGEVIKDNE